MSNRIVLNQLEMEFESEYAFRDLGFTDNPGKLNYRIKKKLDIDSKEIIEFGLGVGIYDNTSGMCSLIRTANGRLVVISYRPFKTREFEIFVRGHEETHAVHRMDKLPLLAKKLEQSGHKIDLSRYNNFDRCDKEEREFVAHLGGFYALQKERSDIAVIVAKLQNMRAFQNALEAFEKS